MLIGYIRVSKRDGSQGLDLQRDALTAAGVDARRIYEDLASGCHDDRPGLTTCLKALQPGHQRQVGLKVLASAGAQMDTTTANGRLIFGIFAALAEFEAALIRERTQAGLTAARARGRVGGRPRKMTATTLIMAMTALADPRNEAKEVAQRLGITTTTLYTYVNGDGSPKAAGQYLLNVAGAADPHAGRRRERT
jgi:DNA invertase Pin-like site-specific DNA recombinase